MKRLLLALICLCLPSEYALAGSQSGGEKHFDTEELVSFAKSVEHYAAKQGARVFIIGRVGQPEDKLPDGIHFTHTAVAIYSAITTDSGETVNGYAIHNLYQLPGELDKSELVVDYPVDFYWGAYELKAGIIIPSPKLQARLLQAFANSDNEKVHNPNYSLIANPFNNQYQNCTEHTLNIVNSAIYSTTDIEQLKANTQAYFSPQSIGMSRLKLRLGSWFVDEVSLADHKGKVKTATFTSIARYLEENQLLKQAVILRAEQSPTSLL